MDEKEFNFKLNNLNEQYQKEQEKLLKEYAFSNNIIKVGDIIQDHYQIIKVEKITWRRIGNIYLEVIPSECVYHGPLYTRKLQPYKSNTLSAIYQMNLKKVIKRGN